MSTESSLQLTAPAELFKATEKVGMAFIGIGLLGLLVAFFGAGSVAPHVMLVISMGALTLGGGLVFRQLARKPAGVDNNGVWFSGATARGMAGWIMAVVFTGFYILLYWSPGALEHLVRNDRSFELYAGRRACRSVVFVRLFLHGGHTPYGRP